MTDFYGLPTRVLSNDFLTLEYLVDMGPRIVRLSYENSTNLLAELPEFCVPTPVGDFRFFGGHRLWHAPESMPRTYIPDDVGLTTSESQDGVVLEGKLEASTGIQKRMEIHLEPNAPRLTLTHTLSNHGTWAVELAPWALTMMRLGGTAVAPMPVGPSDPHGLLPNRQISLWTYSQINDPRVNWDDDFVLIKADPALPPFKFGYFNPHGWLAYWLDGILFCKTFDVRPGVAHPDQGCNAEIYLNDKFIELESLGSLTRLSPGESLTHTETWELFTGLDHEFLSSARHKLD